MRGGWTLIEFLILILVIAILAAVVSVRFDRSAPARLAAAGERMLADLGGARRLAMAEHRRYAVDFAGNAYEILYLDDASGDITSARCPHTGEERYRVDFDSEARFRGVSILSADFDGTGRVWFGSFGKPYDGSGGELSSDGSIVLGYRGRELRIKVFSGTGSAVRER